MKDYNVIENLPSIITKLQKGITITVKDDNKINPMAISWGSIGIKWNKLVFTAYVRTNRHTHKMLTNSKEFTVNLPLDKIDPNIIKITGTKSGKDIDKVKELNLTTINTRTINNSSAIKELPITLECKVLYTQEATINGYHNKEVVESFYPNDVDSEFHGANKDYHTCFYGEIVDSYIID